MSKFFTECISMFSRHSRRSIYITNNNIFGQQETTAVGNNRRLIGSCCGAARGGRSAVAAPTGQRVYINPC